MNIHNQTIDLGNGREITIETGKLAKQHTVLSSSVRATPCSSPPSSLAMSRWTWTFYADGGLP